MAKQEGPYFVTGCAGNICFYKMDGQYYMRLKSTLSGKRVKKDPRFKKTMQNAGLLADASKIASKLYRELPKEERAKGLYRKLTGMGMRLLKEGKSKEEVFALLKENFI